MFNSTFRLLPKVGGHGHVSMSGIASIHSSKTPNWRTVLEVEDRADGDDADAEIWSGEAAEPPFNLGR